MRSIVVGVDGSDESKEALRWAVEEARLRGDTLHVVHVWSYPYPYVSVTVLAPPAPTIPISDFRESAAAMLNAVLDEVLGDAPGVEVKRAVVEGVPAQVLVEAAKDADLLVLGSRGHGGFSGLLLGSVSQQCAHHAECPVVIVRRREPKRTTGES